LDDRYDVWQVLVVVTERVALDQRRKLLAAKRGGLVTRSLSAGRPSADDSESQWQPKSPEPTPEFAAAATEQCRRLLDLLNDDLLRRIALAKVHGLTNDEIAAQEGLSLRGVERKLNIIRKVWIHESHV
jgi:DNA-directed RNA polymerase specialized sigma24 family protein